MGPKKKDLKLQGFISETREILRETIQLMKEKELPLIASSIAYTTILSIVPLLAVSFAIFQSFGGLDTLYRQIEPILIENLAKESGGETIRAIKQFIENIHAGALGVGGLVALFFTSISMLSSAERAINQVWDSKVSRSLFQRVASYWLFISLGPFSLAVILGVTSSSDLQVDRFLPIGGGGFVLVSFVFFSIYKWVPNRHVDWQPPLIAALVTAGLWNLAKYGYALYIQNVVSYNKIYGSLGAIPVILLWIYIIWLVILSGAALAATLQKRLGNK